MNHTVYVMPFALRFVDTDELTVSEARVRRAATDDVMWLVRRRTVAGGAEYTLNTRAGAGDGSYIELDTAVHANAGLSYTAPNPLPLSDLPEEFTVHSVHVVMHRNIAPFYRVIAIEFVALFEVDRHDSRHEDGHVVYGDRKSVV